MSIVDNVPGSTRTENGFFQMSGDGVDDVTIPVVFMYSADATILQDFIKVNKDLEVYLARSKYKREFGVAYKIFTECSFLPSFFASIFHI